MGQTLSRQTNKVLFGVRQEPLRRTGSITLTLAALFTLSTYILQATLNYPAILTAPASLALSLFAQGGIAVLLAFVGLVLCGVLLGMVTFGLVQHLTARARTAPLVTGGATGVIWVVSALGWLVLVPLWNASGASQTYQIFGQFVLILYGIVGPLLLAIWTILLVRLFQAYRVLGIVSAVGLVFVLLRGLFWEFNALVPIEKGYYGTAGVLAILAVLGESLWLVWLFLFAVQLMRRRDENAMTVSARHMKSTDSKKGQENVMKRRDFLTFSTKLGVGLAGGAFVVARSGLTIASAPSIESDGVPSEPSFIGTLVYLIALIDLKFVNPVHTIAQQLAMPQSKTPLPPGVSLEQIDAGGVPAQLIVAPGAVKSRYILYLHGGGFAQAGTDDNRAFVARLSQATGASALYPDYRLAPEHPFPAGLNDCVTAYRWLRSQGVSASHIVIAGESAGGNLTLATALALRESGDELPAALVAISPATDLAMTGETYKTKAIADPILGSGLPQDAFTIYTNHGKADPRNPLVSPLYAHMQGLPPTLLQVGTQEVLLSDSTRMAERMKAAGVPVKLEVWPGMFHAFTGGPDFMPEARLATQHVVKFIRQHIGV